MKKRKLHLPACVVAISGMCVATGCGSGKGGDSERTMTIDLEEAVAENGADAWPQDDWDVRITALEETDSTLLEDIRIFAVSDSTLWGYERGVLYRFSRDGKCLGRIARRGEGPEEYLGILDASVLPGGDIAVLDFTRGCINEYSPDGIWRRRNPGRFGGIIPDADGLVAISMPDGADKPMTAYRIDGSLNTVDSLVISKGIDTSKGFINIPTLQRAAGKPCVMISDTLRSMGQDNDLTPAIIFKTGKLSMPEDVAADYSRRDERGNYISGLYSVVWNDLAFVSYAYNDRMYFDIWNLPESRLCYRNTVGGPEDAYGFPLEGPGGETYNVWPTMTIGDNLVGVVKNQFQASVDDDNDSNPKVFVVRSGK